MKYDSLRRIMQAAVFFIFITQYKLISLGIIFVIGSLLSSNILGIISFIDLFAATEKFLVFKTILVIPTFAVIITLIMYLILGRAFCGWVCPLDIYYTTVRKKELKKAMNGGVMKPLNYSINISLTFSLSLILTSLIVSSFTNVPVFTNYLHVINMLSLVMSRISRLVVFGNLVWERLDYAILFLIFTLFIDAVLTVRFPRFWCRRCCPTGLLYGIFNKFSLLTIKIKSDKCTRCGICDTVCPTEVKIVSKYIEMNKPAIRDLDCIKCIKCIDECPTKALSLVFTKF